MIFLHHNLIDDVAQGKIFTIYFSLRLSSLNLITMPYY